MNSGEVVATLTKQELRRLILERIKAQKEDIALSKSRAICDKLMALPVFHRAQTLLCYASFQGEVDTFGLMRAAMAAGKRVALPRVDQQGHGLVPVLIASIEGLKPGAYGIMEPVDIPQNRLSAAELDLVLVPGVAFDRAGNRMGRGAGYYDRFLAQIPSTTLVVGLAYDFQIVDTIAGLEHHDRPVSLVITN